MFYKAVHLVDALLISFELKRPLKHSYRNLILKEHFWELYTVYDMLFQLSITARYDPELLAISINYVQNKFVNFYAVWKREFEKLS